MSFSQSAGFFDPSALSAQSQGEDFQASSQDDDAFASIIEEGTDENFSSFVDRSAQVPVIIDIWANWCQPCKQLTPMLKRIVKEYAGRFILVTVDVDAYPQIGQAFQVQSIPSVFVLLAGEPAPLFTGALPEEQVRQVFEQVDQVARENGVTGKVTISEEDRQEPDVEPIPQLHIDVQHCLEEGKYQEALQLLRTAISQNPNDDYALSQLARTNFLVRLQDIDVETIKQQVTSATQDLDLQMMMADIEFFEDHVEAACQRLLERFIFLLPGEKDMVRLRIVEYFEILGQDDPRVSPIRRKLTGLLY